MLKLRELMESIIGIYCLLEPNLLVVEHVAVNVTRHDAHATIARQYDAHATRYDAATRHAVTRNDANVRSTRYHNRYRFR